MKGKLNVHFTGEEGVDAGGLTREWFSLLARDMFNPNYALFRREGSKSEFNHPNPLSSINPDHLHYFKFIGRIIGKKRPPVLLLVLMTIPSPPSSLSLSVSSYLSADAPAASGRERRRIFGLAGTCFVRGRLIRRVCGGCRSLRCFVLCITKTGDLATG